MKIPGESYRLTLNGVSARCLVDISNGNATVYYPKYTKLGDKLRMNTGDCRAVAANYVRQDFGLSRALGNPAKVLFTAV